jgi:haloalkane dehalogenase
VAAYDAPFPTAEHRVAARVFPGLVPTRPDDPECAANEAAWDVLRCWHKSFITLFGCRDPITRGGDRVFQQAVPGAAGQAHATLRGAGHFLQEDRGEELAQRLHALIRANPQPAPTIGGSASRGAARAGQRPLSERPRA